MGRAPCCDKANVKRGPWSPEEDAKLKSYIEKNGTGNNWIALPQKIGLKRCGKSCRLRWLNYLRPNIKHGSFSEEEDNVICTLYLNIGSRWSIIAAQLPGRTDNDIKNYWNTRLKKKLLGKQRKEQQAARRANHAMIKQEMKREDIENSFNMMMAPPAAMNLYPSSYWPDLPSNTAPMSVVNPGQEPHIKNQESLKNLLVKLGGNFSNDLHQQQDQHLHQQQDQLSTTNFQYYPYDIPSSQALPLDQNSNINSPHDLPNPTPSPYIVNGDDFVNVQEFNWTIDQLNELLYSGTTNIDQYEGIGSFSGVEMVNGSSGTTTSTESTSWASTDHHHHHHMNSFISPPPPMIGNYENSRQGFVQDSSTLIEEPRYFGYQ